MAKCWQAQFFDRRDKSQKASTAPSAKGKMYVDLGAPPSPAYAERRTKGNRYLHCGTGRHRRLAHNRLTSRFQGEARTHSISDIAETPDELRA